MKKNSKKNIIEEVIDNSYKNCWYGIKPDVSSWTIITEASNNIKIIPTAAGTLMPIVDVALGVLHYKDGNFYVTDWGKEGPSNSATTTKKITTIEDLKKMAIKKGLRE